MKFGDQPKPVLVVQGVSFHEIQTLTSQDIDTGTYWVLNFDWPFAANLLSEPNRALVEACKRSPL